MATLKLTFHRHTPPWTILNKTQFSDLITRWRWRCWLWRGLKWSSAVRSWPQSPGARCRAASSGRRRGRRGRGRSWWRGQRCRYPWGSAVRGWRPPAPAIMMSVLGDQKRDNHIEAVCCYAGWSVLGWGKGDTSRTNSCGNWLTTLAIISRSYSRLREES